MYCNDEHCVLYAVHNAVCCAVYCAREQYIVYKVCYICKTLQIVPVPVLPLSDDWFCSTKVGVTEQELSSVHFLNIYIYIYK